MRLSTASATTMTTSRTRSQPAARRGVPAARHHPIDLALQGGGSHGAYTWGVLDRLLDEERIEIAGVSGTSAGAMNAVVLAAGLMEGGRRGAQAALRRFWVRVAQASPFAALRGGPFGSLFDPQHPWMAPLQWYGDWVSRAYSPYQLNPLNLNPLRDILAETIDFDRVRACHKTRLYIAATHVRSGELRIFDQHELSADVVLASACLPLLFQAVEIEGEAYWDGGFAGNPSLLPLITDSPADDLLLVPINPSLRAEVPTQARDILDRINEVTFNASLLKELRSITLLKQMLERNPRPGDTPRDPLFERVAALRVHRLDGDAELAPLGAGSKLRTDLPFLEQLHAIGHRTADAWLQEHARDLGRRATFDPGPGGKGPVPA
jgi:NTE family protein